MSGVILVLLFLVALAKGQITIGGTIVLNYRKISTPFNNPIGIDYCETSNTLLLTNNYPTGVGGNFRIIYFDGTQKPFSSQEGLTEELKVATVRGQNAAGFIAGDLFTGNGKPGQMIRITNNGARRSLHIDRTGVWGEKLLVVSDNGHFYVVNSGDAQCSGFTKIFSAGVHLEGLLSIPNEPSKFGDFAGSVLIGAEQQNRLYAVYPNGASRLWHVGFGIEDIDMITPGENLFGVNFGRGLLLGVEHTQWSSKGLTGKILVTSERSGQGVLEWDFVNRRPKVTHLVPDPSNPDYPSTTNWEHVTFAPAGINEILPADFSFCARAVTASGQLLTTAIKPLNLPNGNNGITNYGYGLLGSTSASGAFPAPLASTLQMYFGLSNKNQFTFNFLMGSTAVNSPAGQLSLSIAHTGLGGAQVGFLVQDDPASLTSSADFADSFPPNANGVINWRWRARTTDGAVIGSPSADRYSLQSLDIVAATELFEIDLAVLSRSNITSWRILTGPNTFVTLPLDEPIYLQRYSCTCGNGVKDRYEECDLGSALNGAPSSCCNSDCKFVSSNVICRGSAGICDVPEKCTGNTATCPVDTFSTAVCRPSKGLCDVAEVCPGNSSSCPVEKFSGPNTLCRPSAGVCDFPEFCSGDYFDCPEDNFANSNLICRPSSGICDAIERCPGTSALCPPDLVLPSTTICRPANGTCDIIETCTGTSKTCPPDAIQPSTWVCRPAAAGGCDLAETCTGSSKICPTDIFRPPTHICRPSGGICDIQETCPGNNANCPEDTKQPPTVICRSSIGVCDPAENCTGNSVNCPNEVYLQNGVPCDDFSPCTNTSTCQTGICKGFDIFCNGTCGDGFKSQSEECDLGPLNGAAGSCCTTSCRFRTPVFVCRPAAGSCDVAEVCSGMNDTCPTDVFLPSSVTCRSAQDICDVAETCTGNSATCPHNAFVSPQTVCRPSVGICDLPESCTGVTAGCPTDYFKNTTNVCRPSVGVCDVAETCTGSSSQCPVDIFKSATQICRPALTNCDVAEYCTGNSTQCGTDNFEPSTKICRSSIGRCDPLERCTGSSAVCPPNVNNSCPNCDCNNQGTCEYTNGDPSIAPYCNCSELYTGKFCEIPNCSQYSNCSQCGTHPDCGWCCATQTCVIGNSTGPITAGDCPGSYGYHQPCGNITCQNNGVPNCGKCNCRAGTTGDDCSTIIGCDGTTNPVSLDQCNVCGGDGTSCIGCDGIANGIRWDRCGVCGGDGSCFGNCDGLSSCDSCSSNEGCIWCETTSTCVAIAMKEFIECENYVSVCINPLVAGIGAGVVAAIALGSVMAVVIAVVGGKSGYALLLSHKAKKAAILENPLYQNTSYEMESPIFEAPP